MVSEITKVINIKLPEITFNLKKYYGNKHVIQKGVRYDITEEKHRNDLQILKNPRNLKGPLVADLEYFLLWVPDLVKYFRLYGNQIQPFSNKPLPDFDLREFVDFSVDCTKEILDSVKNANQYSLLDAAPTRHLHDFFKEVMEQC